MSESSDISTRYREFANALTEVLAEKCRWSGSARPPCKGKGRRQKAPRL
jgi:hypothetical protein